MATDQKSMKQRAAESALDQVQSGMTLGLGTGSTAELFVRGLAQRIESGRIEDIRCVGTSNETETLARSLGISCESLDKSGRLDLAVDGADEVDPSLRLIKGLGGALLREKIVAQASDRMIIIVDESKLVTRLGRGPLPVEIVAFGADHLRATLAELGIDPQPRFEEDHWVVTDEGHRIVDVTVPADRDIADLVDRLRLIAGVVETGFFPSEASEVHVASAEGIRVLRR